MKRELWHFGMIPEQVPPLVMHTIAELEQMGSQELSARYVRPSGARYRYRVERSVYAEEI